MVSEYKYKDGNLFNFNLMDYTDDIEKVLYYRNYFMILYKNRLTVVLAELNDLIPLTNDCTEEYRVRESVREIDRTNSRNTKTKGFTDFIKRIMRMLYNEFC